MQQILRHVTELLLVRIVIHYTMTDAITTVDDMS